MSYTIEEIARHNEEVGNQYFSRDTLRCFGQSLRSFTVKEVKGRVFVYGRSYDGKQFMGYSLREYNPTSGHMDLVPRDPANPWARLMSESEVMTAINRL